MADPTQNSTTPSPTQELPQTNHETEFLHEPTLPKETDYNDPINYQFALEEYKKKLTTYTARTQWIREQKEAEEREKGIEYPTYNYFCPIINDHNGARKPFKPGEVAIWLNTHDHFKTDKETDILYFGEAKSGRWTEKGEIALKQILANILQDENREAHYRNILHDLKSLSYTDIAFSKKIACENGLLDVETQTLTPFNLTEMAYHEIPVKYNPTAKCPQWEEFITQVVNPDDIATIQEWSGYLLLPDYRYHKLLWIHGEGRNGKGVWQRTMEAILGSNNISGVNLEEFDGNHRFALRQLYGKLFNPCSEPTTTKELQTPLLKKATGQDTIEAEIKGKQQRLQFRNCSKITVMANKFPKVKDNTTAFKERRLFIKFPNEFTGKNCKQNIEENWLTINDEKSGILNWMLEGLKRLLTNGCFTESKTQTETEAQFLRASDTIGAFITEMIVYDKTKAIGRTETYEAYKNYCEVLGLYCENDKKFTQRMKETPKVTAGTIRNPKLERAWKGIKLNQIGDDGEIIVTTVTDVTLLGGFLPHAYLEEESLKRGESSTPVTSVTGVTERVLSQRFCSKECVNYQNPACPLFFNRIGVDHVVPLKCYGFKAYNPGEEN